MGANSTQALGICLFLAAFVLIAAGLASGHGAIPIIAGIVALGAACAVFLRVKPWEQIED